MSVTPELPGDTGVGARDQSPLGVRYWVSRRPCSWESLVTSAGPGSRIQTSTDGCKARLRGDGEGEEGRKQGRRVSERKMWPGNLPLGFSYFRGVSSSL